MKSIGTDLAPWVKKGISSFTRAGLPFTGWRCTS